MRVNRTDIGHIGVFRALQLGDILCAIPAIRTLRLAFPAAKISFIGLPGMRTLIDRFSYVDEFIPFPGYPGLPEQNFDPGAYEDFRLQFTGKFDLLLQMQGNGTIVNSMLAGLCPKQLAGFAIDETELKENPLLMRYPDDGHESSRHLRLLKFLGLPDGPPEMEYPLFTQDRERFICEKFDLQPRYICLHAGSRAACRQWPPALFARIGDLCSRKGYQVVLTGSAAEIGLAQQVIHQMSAPALILAGKTDLGTLGILLKGSCGLIANCTGISHVAAGLKVPSVIISMDGEPGRWGPVDKALHETIDCAREPNYERVEDAVTKRLLRPEAYPVPG